VEKFTPEQNDRLLKRLEEIVGDHDKIIGFCGKMSRNLWPNVLIHYITSAIIICICCLEIMLADGADKLIFVNYIIGSTTQVFVYSIAGNMLEDASTNIRFAAYDFPWYKCDVKIRKMILMIIIRAQKKTAVDVPFFDCSMETFGKVSFQLLLPIHSTQCPPFRDLDHPDGRLVPDPLEDILVSLSSPTIALRSEKLSRSSKVKLFVNEMIDMIATFHLKSFFSSTDRCHLQGAAML
jgi:7tm Odorant receptor